MKVSKVCPKCNSKKIVVVTGKSSNSHKMAYGGWSTKFAKLDRHVCVNCGFTETYTQLSNKFLKWANKNLPKNIEEDSDFV